MPHLSLHSPIGDLTVAEHDGVIIALDWGWAGWQDPSPLLKEAKNQLDAYFDGKRTKFKLPLKPSGTPFQQRVWQHLLTIPYGETETYGEIATKLGTHPRAVGLACAQNAVPIIIPCHRVLSSTGALTGYAGDGGIETKAALLRLEADQAPAAARHAVAAKSSAAR